MALTVESAGRVRQKAMNAVYATGTGTSTNTVSPYHFYAVKSLFLHIAGNKGNIDLMFAPYTAEAAVTAGGTDLVGAACTVYAWYGKARRTSGTTASWQTLVDAAANSTGASDLTSQRIKATGDQFFVVYPNGLAAATGLFISAVTIASGSVESSAADATDGFVIVGA